MFTAGRSQWELKKVDELLSIRSRYVYNLLSNTTIKWKSAAFPCCRVLNTEQHNSFGFFSVVLIKVRNFYYFNFFTLHAFNFLNRFFSVCTVISFKRKYHWFQASNYLQSPFRPQLRQLKFIKKLHDILMQF